MENGNGNPGKKEIGPTAGIVRTFADEFYELAEQSAERSQRVEEVLEGRPLNREEIEFERKLCYALAEQASVDLRSQGMWIVSWMPDGRGLGYVITAQDSGNLLYEIHFRYGDEERPEIHDQAGRSGENLGRAIIGYVCKLLLERREEYRRRVLRAMS